jgi:hypothetical protein
MLFLLRSFCKALGLRLVSWLGLSGHPYDGSASVVTETLVIDLPGHSFNREFSPRRIVTLDKAGEFHQCGACGYPIPANCYVLVEKIRADWAPYHAMDSYLCRDCCCSLPSGSYFHEQAWFERNECTGPCLAIHMTKDMR